MLLAIRDKKISALEAEIGERRKMLLNKYSQLKVTVKDNEFLEGIVQDYGAYYSYIVKQKQDQINSLNEIYKYFDGITENMKLTERALKDAKTEQNRILAELNKIKSELDEVINEDERVENEEEIAYNDNSDDVDEGSDAVINYDDRDENNY
jgi:hypothetical protein